RTPGTRRSRRESPERPRLPPALHREVRSRPRPMARHPRHLPLAGRPGGRAVRPAPYRRALLPGRARDRPRNRADVAGRRPRTGPRRKRPANQHPPLVLVRQMTPSVSVVLPTYNRADSLGRAIESVLAQTFADL